MIVLYPLGKVLLLNMLEYFQAVQSRVYDGCSHLSMLKINYLNWSHLKSNINININISIYEYIINVTILLRYFKNCIHKSYAQ